MTVTSGGTALAEAMVRGVGSGEMRAATRLLGAHRDGYWLRRFAEEDGLPSGGPSLIDRTGTHASVDWAAVGLRLFDVPRSLSATPSEIAVLECATSLVGRCGVTLQHVLRAVDDSEFRLITRAMTEAAYGERALDLFL
ncbi:hypothetical protein ACFY1P_05190 [Streptomyces sp. NPDC001407]|uniref:hypothetical protein n=1 Tax=unclassified Streptomyces TaxID=2593676 RepID=UPI0033F0107D